MKNKNTVTLSQAEYAAILRERTVLRAAKTEVAQLKQEKARLLVGRTQLEKDKARLEQEKSELLREKAGLEGQKAALQQALEDERARLRKVIKEFVARKSERYKAQPVGEEQLSLFAEQLLNLAQTPQAAQVQASGPRKPGQPRKPRPGRRPIPEHLPRLDIIIQPEEDLSGCIKIGEEITEELDYMPGYFFVRRFIRPKYARPEQAGIAIAPLPVRVIDKGIPGPMLLAYILVCKYVDHLPLYRQINIFKRVGVDIDDVTLNGWVKRSIEWLEVLYSRIRDELLKSRYLMADESTIKVLDKDKKGATHLGYYWAYLDPVKRTAVFIYEKGRAGDFVRQHLDKFRGYLQTDAYKAYDRMPEVSADIVMMGCWAHVRRKFIDAQAVDKDQADWFIKQIQLLYAIERFCRMMNLCPEERLLLRQNAGPILEQIHAKMLTLSQTLTPRSVLNTAIRYALNQWEELLVYTTDGSLEIDNNLVENSIRPIALGRKNYLFAGNHEAAQRGAVIYSLLASCKALQLNPLAYLTDVLDKLPTRKVNNIDDLLPWNWTPDNGFDQTLRM